MNTLISKRIISFVLIVFSLLCTYGTSLGTVSPEYVRLAPFYSEITAPTSVAFVSDGRLCPNITEASRSRVVVLSQGENPLATMKPISVAVANNNGRIFVGNKARGNVEVYDAESNLLFKLGQENGEFAQPASIAIDSSGDVHVTDTLNKNIPKRKRILKNQRAYLSNFEGNYGS